jgi:hypothetical protein
MAREPPHSKLLTTAAREVLRPMGLRQKRRSRVWLDDRAWWVGVVEFQASSFSPGTYLNVGAMWLWRRADHVRFEVGHRVEDVGFVEYIDDAQFAPHARRLSELAASRIRALRMEFPTVHAATDFLLADDPEAGLPAFNAAIAAAIAGADHAAVDLLRSLQDGEADWWNRLVRLAHGYADMLDSSTGRADFLREISNNIRASRAVLDLDPDVPLPW